MMSYPRRVQHYFNTSNGIFKGESTAPGRAIRLLPLQLRVRIDRLGLAPAAYMRRLDDIPDSQYPRHFNASPGQSARAFVQ